MVLLNTVPGVQLVDALRVQGRPHLLLVVVWDEDLTRVGHRTQINGHSSLRPHVLLLLGRGQRILLLQLELLRVAVAVVEPGCVERNVGPWLDQLRILLLVPVEVPLIAHSQLVMS